MTHSQVYCTDKLRKNLFFDETRCVGARGSHRDRPLKAPLRCRKAEPLLLRGRFPRRHGVLPPMPALYGDHPPARDRLTAANPTKHNKDHKSAALLRFSFFLFRPLPTLCDRAPRMASPPHFPARPARGHPLITSRPLRRAFPDFSHTPCPRKALCGVNKTSRGTPPTAA